MVNDLYTDICKVFTLTKMLTSLLFHTFELKTVRFKSLVLKFSKVTEEGYFCKSIDYELKNDTRVKRQECT